MSDSSQLTRLSPDEIVIWGPINATILFTWIVMALLALGSWLVTRSLTTEGHIPRWQNLLEIIVDGIRKQIAEFSQQKTDRYLPFIGTLFLFIVISNLLAIVPGFQPPTASLSTTVALAVRLFGNMMSGTKIVAILLAITPLFFPVMMQALGLLTGLIQAYIFAILAIVYLGSATRTQTKQNHG